jgi:CheY-like chemotaxis protein
MSSARPKREPCILLVEDHDDSREVMVSALQRAGYAVREAPDGRAALDVLDAQRPDLLVLDLMLPDFTGWELLRIVRASEDLRSIPVIVVSAYYSPHRELGAVRFVPKPASMDALLRAVREYVGASPRESANPE